MAFKMPKRKTLSRYHQNLPVSHVKHPGDGFYQYVNQNWLNGHHISHWRSEFSASDEVEDKTNKELLDLLDTLHPTSDTRPKTYKGQLALLCEIWNSRVPVNEELYIKLCLNELMAPNMNTIARFFGWMCKSRISTIVTLMAQEEVVSPYFVRASLTPGKLIMPQNYYLNKNLQTTDIWKAYVKYVNICALELGLPFLHCAIEAEQDLAKFLDKSFTILIKSSKGRNLKKWIPEFEWTGFMEGLQTDTTWQGRLWLLDSPEQLKHIIKWICTANKEHVIAVFALHLITFAAPYLRPAIKDAATELFNKALRGITSIPPRKKQFLTTIKSILPDALCSLYSEQQHDTVKLDDIREMVSKLKGAAVDIIEDTYVLSKHSRTATIEKIHRMRFLIGNESNEKVRPLDATFFPESLLHTIISIQSARSSRIYSLTGKPSEPDNDYPCFQANASYYTESNQIVMPWGILQYPFYGSKQDSLGWNYGGIGATIAHEMTHAFDLEGIQYSPRAIYKKWWTRKNRNTVVKRTRRVGKFFGKFKHYGLAIDSKKTTSEDWADFGGLTIALRGLKSVLDSEKCKPAVIKEAYKNFFISYAASWRTLVMKEKMVYAMMTSVHAPAEDRVDRIVPQFQEWVDAFDIREDAVMYIPLGERLKFF